MLTGCYFDYNIPSTEPVIAVRGKIFFKKIWFLIIFQISRKYIYVMNVGQMLQ